MAGNGEDKVSSEKFSGKDVLVLPDGSVYHLGVKPGEVHQRIITVGAHGRAELLAKLLDKTPAPFVKASARLFLVISGYYKGVGVSIIAIGMGAPMVDFLLREVTYVNPGPLAVVRLGTCGVLHKDKPAGTVMVADTSSYVYRNYCHFDGCVNEPSQDGNKPTSPPYLITRPVPGDKELTDSICKNLQSSKLDICRGLNVAGETFYSCQGRNDKYFDDDNKSIMNILLKENAISMEMETHQLFHLAKFRKVAPCRAAGLAVGIVARNNEGGNITEAQMDEAQRLAGKAVLEALIELKL